MPVSAQTHIISSLVLMVIAGLAAPAAAQQVGLPGGASTLNETHGAWTVSCLLAPQGEGQPVKHCTLSQTQLHNQTRQRALAIELRAAENGVDGTLILPFGLALSSGVTFQLDEGAAGAPQQFRTCLSIGCLVDIAFDGRTVESLKTGSTMTLGALVDGGDAIAFSVALTGFASAYDRVNALLD